VRQHYELYECYDKGLLKVFLYFVHREEDENSIYSSYRDNDKI